jgi:hypothetical protein
MNPLMGKLAKWENTYITGMRCSPLNNATMDNPMLSVAPAIVASRAHRDRINRPIDIAIYRRPKANLHSSPIVPIPR